MIVLRNLQQYRMHNFDTRKIHKLKITKESFKIINGTGVEQDCKHHCLLCSGIRKAVKNHKFAFVSSNSDKSFLKPAWNSSTGNDAVLYFMFIF